MESPAFSPESERYMIEHMNESYAYSNLIYAKVYGHIWQATEARMVALDKEGMELEVTVPDGVQRLHIPFEHRLHDEGERSKEQVVGQLQSKQYLHVARNLEIVIAADHLHGDAHQCDDRHERREEQTESAELADQRYPIRYRCCISYIIQASIPLTPHKLAYEVHDE